jgi:hypothetical protein
MFRNMAYSDILNLTHKVSLIEYTGLQKMRHVEEFIPY